MTADQSPTGPPSEEAIVYIPDWFCTDSARGEGWGSRGDECPRCGRYMFDGTEDATEQAWEEHYAEHRAALLEAVGEDAALAWLVERGRLTEETWGVKCLCGKTLKGSPDEVAAWAREHDDSPRAKHIVVWKPPTLKPWTRRLVTPWKAQP